MIINSCYFGILKTVLGFLGSAVDDIKGVHFMYAKKLFQRCLYKSNNNIVVSLD